MNRQQLILARIGTDFDPRTQVPLGPWCFLGKEGVYADWEKLPFFDVFDDAETQWAHWLQVRKLANHLVRRLATELNTRHGTNYGLRYWRELLLLWLLLLIQTSWVRYLHIKAFIEKWPGKPLAVELIDHRDWDFASELDFFTNGSKNPIFDAWVCSLVIERLAPKDWSLTQVAAAEILYKEPGGEDRIPARTNALKRYLRRVLGRQRFFHVTGTGPVASVLMSTFLSLLPCKPAHLPELIDGDDFDPCQAFPNDYLEILETLIPATLPRTFRDDFAAHDEAAKKQGYRAGKLMVTAAAKYLSANRFMTAQAIQAGERILRAQHGAGYGWSRTQNAQEIEYFDQAFLSWGWEKDGVHPDKAVPLPSPMLSRFKDGHRERTSNLIFVGTNLEMGPFPFKAAPQPTKWLTYRRWKVAFLNSLGSEVMSQLLYRPYFRTPSDLEDVGYLEKHLPPLPLLKDDLTQAMLGCRLLVLDHPGTALNIAMAANVPLVGVWEQKAWPLHPEAQPAFDRLREAKILFHDPMEAAAHINAVWADVSSWWNAADVREAHRDWSRQFALADKIWWWPWLRKLATL
ncbi:MAG: hypothetical protein A2516_08620 [Alphaproteobacteria bacterium RIFOXYD12_FULL_60_8]|nr:MAG: hypothetical protein A2516_08620 [Alphaproteobacteria bacterium RIFOXYD12_FULL_60_8]